MIVGLFCGKLPIKIRHPRHLHYPVQTSSPFFRSYSFSLSVSLTNSHAHTHIHAHMCKQPVDIEPLHDRFLLFYSDKRCPHEVMAARGERHTNTCKHTHTCTYTHTLACAHVHTHTHIHTHTHTHTHPHTIIQTNTLIHTYTYTHTRICTGMYVVT